MQTRTSCVFVSVELWTGCLELRCSRDRREEEEEEESMWGQRGERRIQDRKKSESVRQCEEGSYLEWSFSYTTICEDLKCRSEIQKCPIYVRTIYWNWQHICNSSRWTKMKLQHPRYRGWHFTLGTWVCKQWSGSEVTLWSQSPLSILMFHPVFITSNS